MSRLVLSALVNLILSTVVSSDYIYDDTEQKIRWANTALTGRLLYNQLLRHPGQSHSVAALPILAILAQIALHSNGDKVRGLLQCLNLDSTDEIRHVLSSIIQKYQNDSSINLSFGVFADESDVFSIEFEQNFRNICNGVVQRVDYSDVCDANDRINFWFKTKYHGIAGDVIGSDYLWDRGSGLVFGTYMDTLTSFDHLFNPKGFVEIAFRKSVYEVQNQVAVYGNAYARYAEIPYLNAKILILQSKGVQDSVMWLYPNDPAELLSILYKTQDPSVFYGAISQLRYVCLKIHVTTGQSHVINRYPTLIPEINLELSGLNRVYHGNGKSTHVFSILQQLNLIGDKEIREGLVNTPFCPAHDLPFIKFDHPFAYFVLDKYKSPVFAGIFFGY